MCCDVTSQVGRQKPQRAPEIASGTPVTGRRMGVCSRRPSPRNTIACLTLIRSGGWWSSSLSASCFPKYDSGPVSFVSMVFGFHLLNEHVCVCVCAVRYRDERRRVFYRNFGFAMHLNGSPGCFYPGEQPLWCRWRGSNGKGWAKGGGDEAGRRRSNQKKRKLEQNQQTQCDAAASGLLFTRSRQTGAVAHVPIFETGSRR